MDQAEIVERTDGIPLFVEEMTKAVLEAAGEGDARHIAAAFRHAALAVPASLHASLMARLDRLGSAKDVAQIGAAIGREFSHPLLAAVVASQRRNSSRRSTASLKQACCSGRERLPMPPTCSSTPLCKMLPMARYYASRAVRFMPALRKPSKSQFAEIAESQPELLACIARGRTDRKATSLWRKAGEQSVERSALMEAVTQLTRALDQIAALPPTPALRRQRTSSKSRLRTL